MKNSSIDTDFLDPYPEKIFVDVYLTVPKGQAPERIDQYIARHIQKTTRSRVQSAITAGLVLINGKLAKASTKVQANDVVHCRYPKSPPIQLIPQDIPLDIVYEDEYLLVINKQAGLVVHPGVGNRYGTLVNALYWHFGQRNAIDVELNEDEEEIAITDDDEQENDIELEDIEFGDDFDKLLKTDRLRPGIVHRLDKDTSGLILISKDQHTLQLLQKQFANRTVSRTYYAIVWGVVSDDKGSIEANIDRDPRHRKQFIVSKDSGRYAATDYKVIDRFENATLLELKLRTGRTHQIRVHCKYIGHQLVGDSTYDGDRVVFGNSLPRLKKIGENMLKIANRQMLHAGKIVFYHPYKKQNMEFAAEVPNDMVKCLELIR